MIDDRYTFGAMIASQQTTFGSVSTGFLMPGIETSVTYRGNVYPDVGMKGMRLRWHPFRKGFTQTYSLIFRLTQTPDFPQLMRESWRWAWDKLKPSMNRHDISGAEKSLIAQLSSQVEEHPVNDQTLTGITNWRPAVPGDKAKDPKTAMGFIGKALETAEFLLWAANRPEYQDSAAAYRRKGEGLFASFVQTVKLDPPGAEGFTMTTGQPALAIPNDKQVYLRSFTDDLKATLRTYRREKQAGRNHPEWLAWARSFGDWLTCVAPAGSRSTGV